MGNYYIIGNVDGWVPGFSQGAKWIKISEDTEATEEVVASVCPGSVETGGKDPWNELIMKL